jgi:hypothetical protein
MAQGYGLKHSVRVLPMSPSLEPEAYVVCAVLEVHQRCQLQRCGELIGVSIADDFSMTVRHVVGIALIVIGLVSLLWGGFRWTQRKTVLDVGPLKATTEEHKTLPIPPVVGALVLIGGIAIFVIPLKRLM